MLSRNQKIKLVQATHFLMRNWLKILIVALGVLNILPFVAPILMKLGLQGPADFIYTLYIPLCHQMAQRSFFLFGEHTMYSPQELPVLLKGDFALDMLALKAFNGNDTLGWKVAWSDRMVYMYGMSWFAVVFYYNFRERFQIKRINLILFVILLLPMAIDGASHVVSDLQGGVYGGFRYDNGWLATLTNNTLPDSFYVGDKLGSFNSWMRLISGIGFGIGVVWLIAPILDESISRDAEIISQKLQAATERHAL